MALDSLRARVFHGFEWPPGLPEEDAGRIARQVHEEIDRYPEIPFPKYWRGRLGFLARQALIASAWRPVRRTSVATN